MARWPHMLQQILKHIQSLTDQGHESLVVFDLDSTLFDVSPRLEKILRDFADFPVNKKNFPAQSALLQKAFTKRTDWGIAKALERAGLDDQHPEFVEAVKAFWQKNFFSNHYLQFDELYEGALEFVSAIDQAGAHIAYLTGRDVERMGIGSEEQLTSWGFPLHETAKLVLKPHRSLDDAQFKTDYFIEAQSLNYKKVYFFENEPVNLVHLAQFCPEVEMIYFESTHAGKAEPPSHLPKLVNFLISKKDS